AGGGMMSERITAAGREGMGAITRSVVVVAFFAGLILIWQALAMTGRWSPVLLPSPWHVADYLLGAARDGTLAEAGLVTIERLLIGYVIGVAIGLPLGLATSTSEVLRGTIGALAL